MSLSDDEAAILAVINANRIAVWTHDFAAYERCFVHAGYTTRWNASRRQGVFIRHGWSEIAERVKRQFEDKTLYRPDLAHGTRVENLKIRVSGDMAWATFEQHYPASPPGYNGGPEVTNEVRFLERHGGEWRIAFLGFMDQSIGSRELALLRLDGEGTVLWQSATAAAALEAEDDLVIRNGRIRVRDSRTNAKLLAALRWAADRDSQLLPRRGALPIVLDAGEGLPTKVWWVLAEGGMILFSLGDPGFNADRLAAAAAVYNLSAAQAQVAAHVVDGLSVPEIAEAMGITANTARTHLQRIFDKTGVHTQPALVRVLLSAVSPL